LEVLPKLINLKELLIHGCRSLSQKTFANINLPNLENIDLQPTNILKGSTTSSKSLMNLLRGLRSLKVGQFRSTCFGDDCAKVLTAQCPNIVELDVSGSDVTFRLFELLENLKNLKILTASHCKFMQGKGGLLQDLKFPFLQELRLSHSDISEAYVKRILSHNENELRLLDLGSTSITGNLFLKGRLSFNKLLSLSLENCGHLKPDLLLQVNFSELRFANFSGTCVDEEFLKEFIENCAPKLKILKLHSCRRIPVLNRRKFLDQYKLMVD